MERRAADCPESECLFFDSRRVRTPPPEPQKEHDQSPALAFSDLELWLTKYLVYSAEDFPHERYETPVTNPNRLARAAEVSADRAYTFAEELIEEGCLVSKAAGEFIPDKKKLLGKWDQHYRWEDNEYVGSFRVPESDEPTTSGRVQNWLQSFEPAQRHEMVITGLAGLVLFGDHTGPVDTVRLLYLGTGPLHPGEWNLEPVPLEQAQVEIRRARHTEAVNRASYVVDGVMVADEIQQRLDARSGLEVTAGDLGRE